MRKSFDYSQFLKFKDSIDQLRVQYDKFLRDFLLTEALRAMAQTKKLTPVDTGQLRNAWELSSVYRNGDELYIVLFNPLEYASFVEEGHMQHRRFLPAKYLKQSAKAAKYMQTQFNKYGDYGDDFKGIMLQEKWIPGYHMSRISVTKLEQKLPARYDKAFKAFISGLGLT